MGHRGDLAMARPLPVLHPALKLMAPDSKGWHLVVTWNCGAQPEMPFPSFISVSVTLPHTAETMK